MGFASIEIGASYSLWWRCEDGGALFVVCIARLIDPAHAAGAIKRLGRSHYQQTTQRVWDGKGLVTAPAYQTYAECAGEYVVTDDEGEEVLTIAGSSVQRGDRALAV